MVSRPPAAIANTTVPFPEDVRAKPLIRRHYLSPCVAKPIQRHRADDANNYRDGAGRSASGVITPIVVRQLTEDSSRTAWRYVNRGYLHRTSLRFSMYTLDSGFRTQVAQRWAGGIQAAMCTARVGMRVLQCRHIRNLRSRALVHESAHVFPARARPRTPIAHERCCAILPSLTHIDRVARATAYTIGGGAPCGRRSESSASSACERESVIRVGSPT